MPPKDDLWWKQTFAYDLDRSWSVSVTQMSDTENLGYTYSDLSLPAPPPGAALPLRPAVVATGSENAAGPISLNLNPITIEIPLDARLASSRSVDVVLEGVMLTALGLQGGYDFSVYANLPTTRTPVTQDGKFEIGELGSFQLSMPRMNGMTQRFTVKEPGRSLLLSFVAFGSPAGVPRTAELIRIARITVS